MSPKSVLTTTNSMQIRKITHLFMQSFPFAESANLIGARRRIGSVLPNPINSLARLIRLVIATLTLLGLLAGGRGIAYAQTANRWSSQAAVPNYPAFTEEPPFIVADQNHTIHAFNSQPLEDGEPDAIWYRTWTLEAGWSDPIDIIVADEDDAELLDLYVDRQYVVHLVFRVATNIYYTYAPLALAGRAPAWAMPVQLAERALPPFTASIIGDTGSSLYVLYNGDLSGSGVYWVKSSDNGMNWTDPELAFPTYGTDSVAAGLDTYFSTAGWLYAVWNVFDQRGVGIAGYYARLDVTSGVWTTPMELDQGSQALGIKFATVLEYDNSILLNYYNGVTNSNYWRRSQDDGETWSAPAPLSPRHVGTNGPVAYAVDSNHTLHLFFGQRIDDNNHGMWHTVWTGAGWAEPEAVVRGPQIRDAVGGNGFDPRSPKAVVVNGNLLFVTWGTDGAAGENGAWYAYTTLDTPELPAVPLPDASALVASRLPTPTPLPVVDTPTPEPTARPALTANQVGQTDSAAIPLLVGLAPPLLLILGVFVLQRLRHHTRLSK